MAEHNSATWPADRRRPGVWPSADGSFSVTVFAPKAKQVELLVEGANPQALTSVEGGYFVLAKAELATTQRYCIRLDGQDPHPDPASLAQPDGVHEASQVFAFRQNPPSQWRGLALSDMILYELHIGTFSEAGTFAGAVEHLDALVELGINTIELMPLNSFPGCRNWGYDGVFWQAVQNNYGGPAGLQAFIEEAHNRGLAVMIDAVFNHLGPEGNCMLHFAPYLSETTETPWGAALNTDGPYSDGVCDLVLSVAHTWLVDFGADGLRLDAVHAIPDNSARHILEELSDSVARWSSMLGRPLTLVAECDLNDPRYVRNTAQGGYGLDAQWTDEFHHALRSYLTKDTRAYYSDFGDFQHILAALRTGYVYTGQYSEHRKRRFGRRPEGCQTQQFIVFGQNHDQVGNRALGERLHEHLDEKAYLLIAAMVLWSPFTPMLWMGEEYAETHPFPFFVDHLDPATLKSTCEGRAKEFASFLDPGETVPDPGSSQTFLGAKLQHLRQGRVYEFYREAIRIRKQYWPSRLRGIDDHRVEQHGGALVTWRMPRTDGAQLFVLANFSLESIELAQLSTLQHLQSAPPLAASQPLEGSVFPGHSGAVWLLDAP